MSGRAARHGLSPRQSWMAGGIIFADRAMSVCVQTLARTKGMSMSKIYAMLFQLSDPRKVVLLLNLLLLVLALTGCNNISACPSGGSGGAGGCVGG